MVYKTHLFGFSSKLTIFIHISIKASIESAGPTLVTMGFINGTIALVVSLSFARVHSAPVNTTFEEARTS